MILDEFLVRLGTVVETAGIKKFVTALGGVSLGVAGVKAAIGGALAGFNHFVSQSLAGLDDLKNVSERTGESLRFIQEFGYAASLNGSSVEAAARSIEGLSVVTGEAANGLGRGAALFDKLGLSARRSDGAVKSASEVIEDIRAKMQGMSNAQQQSMLSKLGIDPTLVQTLRQTDDALKELYNEAHALGVVTAQGADAAADYNDAMDRMEKVVGALRTNIAVGLAPTFSGLIDKTKGWLIANKDLIREGIGRVVKLLVYAGGALWNFMRAIDRAVSRTVGWKAVLIAVGAALAAAFAANPVTWLIAGIAALIAVVDDFMTYIEGGESALGPFWEKLITFARSARAFIEQNSSALKALGIVLGGLALGRAAAGFGSIAAGALKLATVLTGPLVTAIKVASTVLRVAFMSNPIGLLISLVGLLAFVIYENFDKIKEWVLSTFDSIGHAAVDAWTGFIDLFGSLGAWFGDVFGEVREAIAGAFDAAFAFVGAAWDRAVGSIGRGIEKVKGFFRSIGKTLGLVNEEVQGVSTNVEAQIGAAQVAGNQAAAHSASVAAGGANVTVNQDVKMDIHSSDPTMAGKQAATDLRREQQRAVRNGQSVYAY